jgi:predicted Zn-dependent protease
VYVSGQITFNPRRDQEYPHGFGQFSSRVVLMMHELGHILGLDHVHDPNQMMITTVAGVRDAGAGDLAGLRVMGDGGCPAVPGP